MSNTDNLWSMARMAVSGTNFVLALVVAGILLVASAPAEAARFFRYKDADGRLVLSHSIPNDRVKFGYEIVDETARVLQTIAPQLSEQAYQQKLAEEAATKQCEAAVARVRSLYRSISDIDYAENKALDSLDNQINNTKANLSHLQNQRTELEAQAAQLDIAGRSISNVLLDNIESAKAQETNLAAQIDARYAEKLDVRSSYAYDRQVFHLQTCKQGLPVAANSASGLE